MSGTYAAKAFCNNCGQESKIEAPIGAYVTSQECPHCKTKMLMPAALRERELRERHTAPMR